MREVFAAFLKLGLTSFGGPVAHLGYFREAFVVRRQWLGERAYADLVALCQFLPGPASSQVGFALGLWRAGFLGALAAWAAFTLPSALLLVLFASGAALFDGPFAAGVLHGLKLAAVAVVAQAVWGMARSFCRNLPGAAIALASAAILAVGHFPLAQVGVIAAGAVTGALLMRGGDGEQVAMPGFDLPRRVGIVSLALFFALLVLLPAASTLVANRELAIFDAFYRGWRAGVRWRSRCAAPAGAGGSDQRLGEPGCVPCRLWRSAGCSRPALRLRRLSWRGAGRHAPRTCR